MAVLNPSEARKHRASRHASHKHTAPCGREVWGNGGLASHQNRCERCLEIEGAYLSEWVRRGIQLNNEHVPFGAEMIALYREWQRAEGDVLLARLRQERG